MTTSTKTLEPTERVYNEAWKYDSKETKLNSKITFRSSVTALEESGFYDPWYEEITLTKPIIYYEDKSYQKCFGFVHHVKTPNGDKIRLWVENK